MATPCPAGWNSSRQRCTDASAMRPTPPLASSASATPTFQGTSALGYGLTRIMHRRGRGRCWADPKLLGQGHLRAWWMLKSWMQSARPGRLSASAAWTAPIGASRKPLPTIPRGTGGRGDLASAEAAAPLRVTPAAPRPPAAGGKAACQAQPTGRRSGGLRTGHGPITPTVLSSRVRAPRL